MADTSDSLDLGGGHNHGPSYILSEIDPDTLPRDPADCWEEVVRRAEAYDRGLRGWRTGNIEQRVDEWGDDDG